MMTMLGFDLSSDFGASAECNVTSGASSRDANAIQDSRSFVFILIFLSINFPHFTFVRCLFGDPSHRSGKDKPEALPDYKKKDSRHLLFVPPARILQLGRGSVKLRLWVIFHRPDLRQ